MNGTHVLAFVIGAVAILACQLFAALLLFKRSEPPKFCHRRDDNNCLCFCPQCIAALDYRCKINPDGRVPLPPQAKQ